MSEDKSDVPETFEIFYVESNFLRTVQADGATGSFSPQGRFMIVFYSEHPPLPDHIIHKVNDDGSVGEVIDVKGRFGVKREKEVVVSMDPKHAEQLANWIKAYLETLEEGNANPESS
ncbi:MAG: hypothetical protein F4X08_08970 [Gemmatimonadetes bacterium]|nr:hypothetical protein [Gammaproteobacteria bacterium]MYD25929.1 hypothetical protein [Gemmatimonadota bacterium]